MLYQHVVQDRRCDVLLKHLLFFLMIRRPPRSPLFPDTTRFRSLRPADRRLGRLLGWSSAWRRACPAVRPSAPHVRRRCRDRKSTRLNSSHANISYAVFCLKKKRMTPRQCCTTTVADIGLNFFDD